MGRLFAAALIAGGISASFSTAQAATIGIDFGCDGIVDLQCTSGDDPLQSGYTAWTGPHSGGSANYNVTRSFTAGFGDSGTFDLTVTSTALYFRDYSALTGTYASQSNLLSDGILRNQPGSIVFTFSGLTAGDYSMQSFHHDSDFGTRNTVPFDITVADAMGISIVASGIDTSGGTSPTAITTALYTFIVGEAGTASITFNYPTSLPGDGIKHMTINGFQLTDVAPVPLPAGVWLLLSALGGLGFAGWRKRAVAA